MTVNAVGPAFAGKVDTKNGNKYEKSNSGKTIGFLAGAGYGGYELRKSWKIPESFFAKKEFIKRYNMYPPEQLKSLNITRNEFVKNSIKTSKGLLIGAAALITVFSVIFGSIVDKIANSNRAAKADKIASNAQ